MWTPIKNTVKTKILQRRFLRESATLQASSLLSSAGNFFSTVALAFILGARGQGDYLVAVSLYSLFYFLLPTGVNQAAVSQVASVSARGNRIKEATWLALLVKVYVLITIFLVIVGGLLLPRIAASDLMGGDRHLGELAWWLTLTPLLELPRTVCQVAFQATRRMVPLAQTENAHEFVRLFLVVIGALVTGKPEGAILGALAASLIGSVVAVEIYRRARIDSDKEENSKLAPLVTAKEILTHLRDVPLIRGVRLGIRIGLLRSIDALGFQVLPALIIKALVGSEVVAYTRIAQRIMNVPVMLMGGISRAVFPVLNQMAGLKDMVAFKRTFIRTTLMGGTFVAVGVVLALPVVRVVVQTFFPPEYVDPVVLLTRILVVGYVPFAYSICLDSFFIVTNRMRGAITINTIGIISTMVFTAWMCTMFPETGGAWGLVFGMAWVSINYVYVALVLREVHGNPADVATS